MSQDATVEVYCCGCGKNVDAVKTSASRVYHGSMWNSEKFLYVCPVCGNYVGMHADGTPFGVIPTPALRQWRQKLHDLLDPVWRKTKLKRCTVYRLLSGALGKAYHTAEIRNVEEAEQAKNAIQEMRSLFKTGPLLIEERCKDARTKIPIPNVDRLSKAELEARLKMIREKKNNWLTAASNIALQIEEINREHYSVLMKLGEPFAKEHTKYKKGQTS